MSVFTMADIAGVLFFVSVLICAVLTSGHQSDLSLTDRSVQRHVPPSLPETRRVPVRRSGTRFQLLNSRFIRKPRKKHLDAEYLHGLLGDHFDGQWMSEEKPPGDRVSVQTEGWAPDQLKDQLEAVNLTAELTEMGAVVQDPSTLVALKKWLLRRGSCPVRYFWEDVGNLFWPRWIKRGDCINHAGACSWPPGMHCVPSETLHLKVLRWQCRLASYRSRGNRRRREWRRLREMNYPGKSDLKCQWIVVPYPVTSGCHCTC